MRELAVASLAGVLISLALSAGAADISAMTAPYLAARERRSVGTVVGRAYEEARRGRSRSPTRACRYEVKAGEETQVRLHDRNMWLIAIREDRSARDPEKRIAPGKQQGANPR